MLRNLFILSLLVAFFSVSEKVPASPIKLRSQVTSAVATPICADVILEQEEEHSVDAVLAHFNFIQSLYNISKTASCAVPSSARVSRPFYIRHLFLRGPPASSEIV
jgi:hypothetical protein